jgi:multimeric flavodoxin WrbA
MKLLAINGSPRGKRSTSYLMVEAFLSGTRECGVSDNHILLAEMNIHHCMGCFHCWKNQGQCIFDDDMKKIPPFHEYDVLLLATPVYCDNMTGLMKNFFDREVARHYSRIEAEPSRPGLKLIVMANCGDCEQTNFDVVKMIFRRKASNAELLAEIYRTQGEVLITDKPRAQANQARYKELLRHAGREVAQNLALSPETKRKLEEPFVPFEEYVKAKQCKFCG